ncbi:MAG: molybdate ABC transporter substrate-binding protein [Dehalococcoidia bacterium]|nr:molybdate ABC transporter substrate-binding protein [Dehalococcoidia bacterium]
MSVVARRGARRRWLWLLPLAATAAMLGACGDDANETPTATMTASAPTPGGTLSVFAAASLSEAFRAIGNAFEAEHPDVSVEFNFAGSSALATQVEQAAPSDVFASANMEQMQRLVDADLITSDPRVFAQNLPVIVVPADNPGEVSSAADLADSGLSLVLALEDVPAGQYARDVFANLAGEPEYGAGFEEEVLDNVVSSEEDVRAVLVKVELGEADAGVVYKTDAAVTPGTVRVIEFPVASNVIANYPIAGTADTDNPEAAAAFIDFVLGETAQGILTAAGFDPAP